MFRFLVAAFLVCTVSCELSADETKLVKEAWGAYHTADPTETGVALFHKFLEKNPTIKADFPKFKDVKLADLPSNADFRAHGTKIFHVIDDAIYKQNWEDVEKLSSFHKKVGSTDQAKFNAFRTVLVDFLNLNDAQKAAFNKSMDQFFHHFFKNF